MSKLAVVVILRTEAGSDKPCNPWRRPATSAARVVERCSAMCATTEIYPMARMEASE